MEGLDIAKILAEFALTGVVLWLCDRQIKILQDQIKDRDTRISRLEAKLDDCSEGHLKDLRDWSGIDPRFKTWSVNAESDTKLRLRMEERERLREHVDKLEPPR